MPEDDLAGDTMSDDVANGGCDCVPVPGSFTAQWLSFGTSSGCTIVIGMAQSATAARCGLEGAAAQPNPAVWEVVITCSGSGANPAAKLDADQGVTCTGNWWSLLGPPAAGTVHIMPGDITIPIT
jgi:hypothetical protein